LASPNGISVLSAAKRGLGIPASRHRADAELHVDPHRLEGARQVAHGELRLRRRHVFLGRGRKDAGDHGDAPLTRKVFYGDSDDRGFTGYGPNSSPFTRWRKEMDHFGSPRAHFPG